MNEVALRKLKLSLQDLWQDLPDNPSDSEVDEVSTLLSNVITRVSLLIENKGKAPRRVKSARMKRRT